MAVSPRTMHIPAGLPIDEATRLELLDVGGANVANRNVRIIDRGALDKRFGFDPITTDIITGGDITAGRKLFAHGDASMPCVVDGTHLHAYSENADAWVTIGRVPEVAAPKVVTLPTPASGANFLDSEYVNGYLIVAAQRTVEGQPTVAVIDYATGALVLPHEDLGTDNGHIILGAFGTRCIAFVQDYSVGAIEAYILDTADIATGWTALTTVAAASATFCYPSVANLAAGVALVYGTTSSSTRVTVALVSEGGVGSTTSLSTSSNTPSDLDIDAADVIWVAWAIEGAVDTAYACALNLSSLAVVGTTAPILDFDECTNLRICASDTVAQSARAFTEDPNVSGQLRQHFDAANLVVTTGAVVATTGAGYRFHNATPVSRPFCRGGRYYMAVAPSPDHVIVEANAAQALNVLVDWTDNANTLRPVANIEPGLCPGVARYAKVNTIDAYRYAWGFQLLKSGSGNIGALVRGNGTVGLAAAEISFSDRERWQTARRDDATFIGGGVLSVFDGARVVESGFLGRPNEFDFDASGAGTLDAATGYRYVAIYEDVDAAGNWTVSGISDPSDSTGALASKVVVVSVPPVSVTSRIAGGAEGTVRVAFYRTSDGGEPPYYRLGATVVDPSTSLVSFDDEVPDADLTACAQLYAPGAHSILNEPLDRRAPAGLRHIVSYAGMLVGAKGSSLYWSGQEVYGEGTWFSPVFELPITGGEITALAAQDGALVVFKRDCIYILAGETPSDNGAVGGLGTPRLLASDVGCIDANSVVVCSLGIFFQSDRGIELFTRSQSVEWIGEQIQDTLAAYPTITSAVVDVRNALVRFTLAQSLEPDNTPTGPNGDDPTDIAGKSVIYDVVLRAWVSVDDFASQDAAQHACYIGDRYGWLASNGIVKLETEGWLDDGEWVQSSFTIPPWKLGLQQDQRIWEMQLLFQTWSSAGVLVEVAEDYGDFADVTANKTWTPAAIAALSSSQIAIVPRDHGFAMQLRISDVEPDTLGTGRGLTFIGISADIAQKSGQYRNMPRLAAEARK